MIRQEVVSTSRLKGIPDLGTRPNYSHKKTKIERLRNLDRDSILLLRLAIFSSGQQTFQRSQSVNLFVASFHPIHAFFLSYISRATVARYIIIFLRKTKPVALYVPSILPLFPPILFTIFNPSYIPAISNFQKSPRTTSRLVEHRSKVRRKERRKASDERDVRVSRMDTNQWQARERNALFTDNRYRQSLLPILPVLPI